MNVYNARRYEVLVKSAAGAFLDGYTNETVAVMSSALERAYEFYIRVSCRAKGIDQNLFTVVWKGVASQSERQYGAFYFLYLTDHSEQFHLAPFITEVRNKVVHRGKIVREEEALRFAEAVYATIANIENAMQKTFGPHVAEEALREVKFQEQHIPAEVQHLTLDATIVHVDKSSDEVVGKARKFMDFVAAIHQARDRGFPI
jgi:intracellular sulfur oxidation DsrE/DsrF family protein